MLPRERNAYLGIGEMACVQRNVLHQMYSSILCVNRLHSYKIVYGKTMKAIEKQPMQSKETEGGGGAGQKRSRERHYHFIGRRVIGGRG